MTPAKSNPSSTAAETPSSHRATLREGAAATVKVILLTGGLLGGLWLLQMVAQK